MHNSFGYVLRELRNLGENNMARTVNLIFVNKIAVSLPSFYLSFLRPMST